jgi:hypothetical protein
MAAETLISGLDLGKNADFSVFVVVGRSRLPHPVAKRRYTHAVRWLQAWDLGTRYTATKPGERSVIGDVKARFESPQLRYTPLAVDYTGVGMAVVEQVLAAKVKARLNAVCITSGHSISAPGETKDRSWHVPKKELVSTLVVLLENDLLKWQRPDSAGALPLIGRFEKELAAFREHVTRKKNVTYGAEQSQHDDIVMAVALACWLGEHTGTGDASEITVPEARVANCLGGAPSGVFAEEASVGNDPRYFGGRP